MLIEIELNEINELMVGLAFWHHSEYGMDGSVKSCQIVGDFCHFLPFFLFFFLQ